MNQNIIPEPVEFEWDKGNIAKNFKKHSISNEEAEELFFNKPITFEDATHSKIEKRYKCLGITDENKKLFASFTIRNGKVRIISVRRMDKKEMNQYDQKT